MSKNNYENVTFFQLPGKCHPSDFFKALFDDLIQKKPDRCEKHLYSALCKRTSNKLSIIFTPSIEIIIHNYACKHGCLPMWTQVEFQVASFFHTTKGIFVNNEKTSYLGELLSKYELLVKQKNSIIDEEMVQDIRFGFNSDCEQVDSILELIVLQYQYEEAYIHWKEGIDRDIQMRKQKEQESKITNLKNKRDKKKKRGLKVKPSDMELSEIIEAESPESKRAREELEQEEQKKEKQEELKVEKNNKKKLKKYNKMKAKQLNKLIFPKWINLYMKIGQSNNLRILFYLKGIRFRSLIKIQRFIRQYLLNKKRNLLMISKWKHFSVKVFQINQFQNLSELKESRYQSLFKIQGIIRSYLSKQSLLRLKTRSTKSILIQTLLRKFYYSKKWKRIKRNCHKIQSTVRMRILNKNYRLSYNQESPNLTKKKSEVTENKQLCQPINQSYSQKPICRYFQNGVYCPWGENCRYSHGEKDLRFSQITLNELESTTECWYGRMCRKPDCPYVHIHGRVAFPLLSQ